jgi:hypothetical protein
MAAWFCDAGGTMRAAVMRPPTGGRSGGHPGQRHARRGLLLHILPEQRPPQVPRERHLRLGAQRGEFPGRALLLRGGFPDGPLGGGQVNPELLRLAECPGQPIPYAGRLAAGPGDDSST